MSKIQLLTEHLNPNQAALKEQKTGNDMFLSGILMQSELRNGNGRVYGLQEITREVDKAAKRIAEGHFIMGELNHPDTLSINLANVSHCITEIKMVGNNAIGKMKLLNTPAGNIAKGIIEGGVRLGVSSRGAGGVNEQGMVEGFDFTTVDIVNQPSAPEAYPSVVMEALGSKRIMTLAESVVHDPRAQASLQKEIFAFLESLGMRK